VAIQLRTGGRVRSATCTAEFIVVKAPAEPVDLRCGGEPVIAGVVRQDVTGSPGTAVDGGSSIGKRYVDATGAIEVLCTKSGPSALSTAGEPLVVKGAKPLPSSD